MQKYLLYWFVFLLSFSGFCQQFPSTKKTPSTFTKHTFSYEDDYSWLEKMGSEEVNQWVATQNSFTDSELEKEKKEYNIGKVWSLKNVQTKNFLKNNTNKKILFWGIGSTFFQFTRGLKMQNYKNLNYTDIKGDGENILKFKRFKNQTFDFKISNMFLIH
jgi:hypothetical protein